MKALSAEDMRLLDARTIQEEGISGERLMKTAGAALASAILRYIAELSGNGIEVKEIVFLAGKGNNAGDAFVAAKMLYDTHLYKIHLLCMVREDSLSGDALTVFREMPSELKSRIKYTLEKEDLITCDLIIDGLLGTGFRGELRGDYGKWIASANNSSCHIVAIDLPSGMEANTGKSASSAIHADLTVTMANPKKGMLTEEGAELCGRIRVMDIGIPERFEKDITEGKECTTFSDVKHHFKKEKNNIHKNSRGHVLVAGGCSLYCGAPLLAGESALRTGAGLVSILIPEGTEISGSTPKALMIRHISGNREGFFDSSSIEKASLSVEKADRIVIGPGMGTNKDTLPFLEYILQQEKYVVADADALNLLAQNISLFKTKKCTLILTPHEGEMRRLEKGFILDSTLSREERVKKLAEKTSSYVIFKGLRTIVCTPDGKCAVNLSGSPALATAGSGDVLSGICGAILKKDEDIFSSLRAAVFLHGLAGEMANPSGSRGVIADDLIGMIAPAMRQINPKA